MNVSRVEPLNRNGVATLPKRPEPWALRALTAKVTLSAQALAGATVQVTFTIQGDGFVTTSTGATNRTFAFAAADPGGGVVWVDTSGFSTLAEYANAFQAAADAQGELVASVAGTTVTVTTAATGSDVSLTMTNPVGTLTVTFSPVSGEADGTDAGVLLPVVTFNFGGVANMVRVFPEPIANDDGGVYVFNFAEDVDPVVAVDPTTGETWVTVKLPENLGLPSNVEVTFDARSNAPVSISEAWASIEILMFDAFERDEYFDEGEFNWE